MSKVKAIFRNKTLYGAAMVLLLWYFAHYAIGSAVIPSPHETFANFLKILPRKLSMHLLVSLLRITAAVGLSLFAGSAIGIWIGTHARADALISPIVYILYPLPKIAFLPILMILFGLGNTPKIALIVIIIIFQFIIAARDGVKEIPKELMYSVASLGIGKPGIYRHLIIPYVLPNVITALRISVGVSISVLFFSENFATTYGIGYFIMNCWVMVNYVEMFSGILALSIMGFLLFRLIDLLEHRLCKWKSLWKSELPE